MSLSSFDNVVNKFYENKNSSSLGITRILFGMMMLLDVLYERGGMQIMSRWGNPKTCHFPLFPLLTPGLPYIAALYGLMWAGALGITLGFKFRLCTLMFSIPYWFILLLDKSYWNNHSYLFGVVSLLFIGSSANYSHSLDSYFDKTSKRSTQVPFWNYFILRYQFFMLYFVAGLKKIDSEWLNGYSMRNLSDHWVFDVFKFFLTKDQIDYIVVHLFGFFLDLTLGFWLLLDKTRPYGMVFGMAFHFMNSRLFSIGVFPYVCMVTMPIFCAYDWPESLKKSLFGWEIKKERKQPGKIKISWKRRIVTGALIVHCCLQGFLPYSHFITKGFNNWTNGLYGYSWDMMVHSWNTALVVVQVKDNESGKEFYISSDYLTTNDRWSKHADMCLQYAHCLKDNFENLNGAAELSSNISIYVDVWCSLNGRFQQRMFDPNYDLLRANWSPFEPVEWLLPLLFRDEEFRQKLKDIQLQVYSWSNYSDVLFVADFPGMHLENFLSTDLTNITLSVLRGTVVYQLEETMDDLSMGIKLPRGSNLNLTSGSFHKVHTIGHKPSLYMYTYVNDTKE